MSCVRIWGSPTAVFPKLDLIPKSWIHWEMPVHISKLWSTIYWHSYVPRWSALRWWTHGWRAWQTIPFGSRRWPWWQQFAAHLRWVGGAVSAASPDGRKQVETDARGWDLSVSAARVSLIEFCSGITTSKERSMGSREFSLQRTRSRMRPASLRTRSGLRFSSAGIFRKLGWFFKHGNKFGQIVHGDLAVLAGLLLHTS